MFDDLAAYFYENVALAFTTYRDIRNDRVHGRSKDLRAALVAAAALFHFHEHIPAPRKETRAAIAAKCPDFDLLGDIVNASKHRDLTQGNPRVNSAEDIYEQVVLASFEDAEGEYTDGQNWPNCASHRVSLFNL